jgi:alpha-D-ribose 1-methylphosphonate 5-triphosphate synthase subunit PhnG
MLQVIEGDNPARREWLSLLSRAPLGMLEQWYANAGPTAHRWLRAPETGLVMVRGRAGGTGEQFNLGEMTLTRCALRIESGEGGVAYVQGRSHRRAELAALADALLQSPRARAVIEKLVIPLRERLAADAAAMERKAQATRVEFFTLAREAGE